MVSLGAIEDGLKKNIIIRSYLSIRDNYLAGKNLLSNEIFMDGINKTKKEIDKVPTRSEVINYLLSMTKGETRYLEIGVRNPDDNFNKIKSLEKYSVDPGVEFHDNPADFKVTSDVFFGLLAENKILKGIAGFDVIFIDGLHSAEQVDRDIENSFKWIKDTGFIVLHDCNPPTEWHAREGFKFFSTPAGPYWNGTTWKAFMKWRTKLMLNSCCIDSDWGIGILTKNYNVGLVFENRNEFYNFDNFDANKKVYLNLLNFDEFKDKISNNNAGKSV